MSCVLVGGLYYEVSGLSKMLYVVYSLALNFIINLVMYLRSAYSVCMYYILWHFICTVCVYVASSANCVTHGASIFMPALATSV